MRHSAWSRQRFARRCQRLLLLAGVALLLAIGSYAALDGQLAAPLRSGVWHHRLFGLTKLAEGVAALLILGIMLVHLPWRGQKRGFVLLVGTLALVALLEVVKVHGGLGGLPRTLVGNAQALLAWTLPLLLLLQFANGQRLIAGFLSGVLLSTALTHVLKWMIGRARPELDVGPYTFDPMHWPRDGKFESLPSGHSSGAAALAAVLALMFPRARWLLLLQPLAVGAERMLTGKHFLSDVLAGWCVGLLAVGLTALVLGPRYFKPQR